MLVWASALAAATGVPISMWVSGQAGLWVVGSLLGAGLLGGGALALARPGRLVSAAAHVDEALRLEDRISSALELESTGHTEDAAFSQLAVLDAERQAGQVKVAQAVPVRLTWDWVLWPMLSAAAVAGVLLIPPLVRQANQASPGEIARARDSIVRASQAVEDQLNAGEGAGEAADEETLARLDDIERELADGRSTPERARTESAAVLEERARELDEQAHRQAEELTRALRQIEPDPDSSVTELAEALRRSDYAAAGDRLRELAGVAQNMDETARQTMAEDLRDLARQIREADQRELAEDGPNAGGERTEESGSARSSPPSEPPAEQTGDAAQDEEIRPETAQPDAPSEQPSPQSSVQEESGAESPEQAPGRAPEQAPDESRPKSDDQSTGRGRDRSPGEELSDRLDDLAEQIERDPGSLQPHEHEPKPGDNGQPAPESPQTQPDRTAGPEQEGQQPQPGGQGAEPTPQPGEQAPESPSSVEPAPNKQSSPGQERQPPPEGAGEENPKPDPGALQPPGGSDRSEGTPAPGEQAEPAAGRGEEGQPSPGQVPSGESPATGPESLQPGTEPGEEQSNGQQGQGGSLREMLDQLEKMDQRKLEALQKMARSEKLREAARELLDDASAEDLERLRNLAGRFGREPLFDEPPPMDDWKPETEFFDARGQGADASVPTRVVGAAEGTGAAPGRSIAGASRAEVAERVREAAAGAERAIEGQSIPPRMRNYVRSVYRRFEESAGKAPVREGRDADDRPSD
ncbi:MAG: hypothetical protein DYG94_06285 [Leptolyngbya sp. PLA3]|nr:hypothetical protein [Leptolyngbya sp. PL-A3]